MSTPDTVTPAILDYANHGAYPESEDVAAGNLSSSVLGNAFSELSRAQDAIKSHVRIQSRAAAPDIDEWIARAKELQADIRRSRETARQVVAEAEAGDGLKATVEDAGKKVGLLEKEVAFNETLFGTLEHVRYASSLLDRAQDDAVLGNIEGALARFEDAEASIAGLEGMATSTAYAILRRRAAQLKDSFAESATELWNALITVDVEQRSISVRRDGLAADVPDAAVSQIGLDAIITATTTLGVFDHLVKRLARDIDKVIIKPRLMLDDDLLVGELKESHDRISCLKRSANADVQSVLRDLPTVIDFFEARLPSSITTPLSIELMPPLILRLKEQWLAPALPLKMSEMPSFQHTLESVTGFADQLRSLGWHGGDDLQKWVQSAPQTWLKKRREAMLAGVRNLVFNESRQTKVIERVETQLVDVGDSSDATRPGDGEEDDQWDTAWDEADDSPTQQAHPDVKEASNNDEDTSAWEVDDDDGSGEQKAEADDAENAWDMGDDQDDKEDAWGWGDEETDPNKPNSLPGKEEEPEAKTAGSKPPKQRELTLRENFTVTAVPQGILQYIENVCSDAETLAGPEFASSPIAPAAGGLYTLPAFALSMFRATAPTAYSKLETGNMLIYNDSSHLADQLRSWLEGRRQSSRLRLDNEIKALDSFAKRAYSSEMEAQRTILRDLVDGAQGFSNCTVPPYKAECQSAIEQTRDRLHDVQKTWKDVLSQSALLQSLGSLVATVAGKIISEIEDLGDIGEADSHQLTRLLKTLSSVKDMFIQRRPGGPPKDTDMTFIYCPNWLKFLYMAEILQSSLADIKYMWTEGELSLEFDVDEMVELIEALFAESDHRRQAIREIRKGGIL